VSRNARSHPGARIFPKFRTSQALPLSDPCCESVEHMHFNIVAVLKLLDQRRNVCEFPAGLGIGAEHKTRAATVRRSSTEQVGRWVIVKQRAFRVRAAIGPARPPLRVFFPAAVAFPFVRHRVSGFRSP
jgi:hypothetical protein